MPLLSALLVLVLPEYQSSFSPAGVAPDIILQLVDEDPIANPEIRSNSL